MFVSVGVQVPEADSGTPDGGPDRHPHAGALGGVPEAAGYAQR